MVGSDIGYSCVHIVRGVAGTEALILDIVDSGSFVLDTAVARQIRRLLLMPARSLRL